MLNYLSSEMFRAKKSFAFKMLILAGILFLLYLAISFYIYTLTEPSSSEYSMYYLEGVGDFSMFMGFVGGIFLLNYLYKDEDYHRIALSSGKSKMAMILENLLTINLLSIIYLAILGIMILIMNYILSLILGFDHTMGLAEFIDYYKKTILLQFFLNQQMIGIIYLTNNKGITTFLFVFFGFNSSLAINYMPRTLNLIFKFVFPYYYLAENEILPTLNLRLLILYILNAALYVSIAHLGFRRREY